MFNYILSIFLSAIASGSSPLMIEDAIRGIGVVQYDDTIAWCDASTGRPDCGVSEVCRLPERIAASRVGILAAQGCDGVPVEPGDAIESLASPIGTSEALPATCGWKGDDFGNTCELFCGDTLVASCVRTATGVVGCATADGSASSVAEGGTLPCEHHG